MGCWSKRCGVKGMQFWYLQRDKIKDKFVADIFSVNCTAGCNNFSGYLKTKTIKTETTGRPDKNYLKAK